MNKKKLITTAILTGFLAICTFAQSLLPPIERGKKVLQELMLYHADSVYAQCSQTLQATVSAEQFKMTFPALEMSYGKVDSITNWQTKQQMGYDIVLATLHMKRHKLMASITFEGIKIMGLYFKPLQEAKKPIPQNNESFVEIPDSLTCDGYTMPAILTLPHGVTAPPCVVIVHGSGPQDMDGAIGANKTYRDLAIGLAKRGIASFRYDKRTYTHRQLPDSSLGKMTIDFETTDDAVAAVAKLGKMGDRINVGRIVVIGHSQGGMLIPRIAERTKEAKGFIMMSAPAGKFDTLMLRQLDYLDSLGLNPGWGKQRPLLVEQFDQVKKNDGKGHDRQTPNLFGAPACYWQDLFAYDQVAEAQKISRPLLILNGESDYQVTMAEFNVWKRALADKKNVTFKSYRKLSHIYTPAGTPPSPNDYNKKQDIPAEVLDDIAAFVKGI